MDEEQLAELEKEAARYLGCEITTMVLSITGSGG